MEKRLCRCKVVQGDFTGDDKGEGTRLYVLRERDLPTMIERSQVKLAIHRGCQKTQMQACFPSWLGCFGVIEAAAMSIQTSPCCNCPSALDPIAGEVAIWSSEYTQNPRYSALGTSMPLFSER